MSPGWPLRMLRTITFAGQAGRTTVTVRWRPFNATEEEYWTFEAGYDSMGRAAPERSISSPAILRHLANERRDGQAGNG